MRNVFRQVGRASTPSFHALAPDANAQNKLSLLSSCKIQQCSVGQCICAGRSCSQRLHHDVGPRCQVCQRFVGPRRCGSKPFCRLEDRVAGASVSRQCLRHTVCKLKTSSRARAARLASFWLNSGCERATKSATSAKGKMDVSPRTRGSAAMRVVHTLTVGEIRLQLSDIHVQRAAKTEKGRQEEMTYASKQYKNVYVRSSTSKILQQMSNITSCPSHRHGKHRRCLRVDRIERSSKIERKTRETFRTRRCVYSPQTPV